MKKYKIYLKNIGVYISWVKMYQNQNIIKQSKYTPTTMLSGYFPSTNYPFYMYDDNCNFIDFINEIKDLDFKSDNCDNFNNLKEIFDDMMIMENTYIELDEGTAFYYKLKYGIPLNE